MINRGEHKNGEIEIKQPELVFANKFVDVFNDAVIFPSGNEGTYVRVTGKPTRSVAVLPITALGNIVVVKNFRHGARGWGLEIPKGAVEVGESDLQAAARELQEETGYTFEKLIPLGEYSESPAIFSNKINCFIATNCSPIGERKPENTEAISGVYEMSIQEFSQEKAGLDFVDALTDMLIYRYIIERKDIDE